MSDRPPTKVPDVIRWVDELPKDEPTKESMWDPLAQQIRNAPGTGWAEMERPEPWNSAFPTWFRRRYKDLELICPPIRKDHQGPKLMYMRRKPLAPSPVDKR